MEKLLIGSALVLVFIGVWILAKPLVQEMKEEKLLLDRVKQVLKNGPLFYYSELGRFQARVLVLGDDYRAAMFKHQAFHERHEPLFFVVTPAFLFYVDKDTRINDMASGSEKEMWEMIERLVEELFNVPAHIKKGSSTKWLKREGLSLCEKTNHIFIPFTSSSKIVPIDEQLKLFGDRPKSIQEVEEFLLDVVRAKHILRSSD